MIPIEVQADILTRFFSEKQSVRRIANDLGLSRKSISRIISRRSIRQERQVGQRSSILDPFKEEVTALLNRDPHCTATAVINRLRDIGYLGGISTVQLHVKRLRAHRRRPKEAFLRLEFTPGDVAQVDWGEFGDVFSDGSSIHCFAMVLCHSRYLYIEFTRSEKFEEFIRCHESAFTYFKGVPRQCWYDNLTTAVTDRLGSLIKFNTRFLAYMGHHGIRPHACNVARGNEKGRVEDLIKYIRLNFWPARTFTDFDDLQSQAATWRDQIANQREHRSTRRIVRLHFQADEQKCLSPMNPHRYDTDEILAKVVPPDFHVVYETNRYSVPWTLVGMSVTLRINARQIDIYYHQKQIASHERSYLKGRVFSRDAHKQGLLARKPGATKDSWQVAAVKNIGPKMIDYIDLLRSGHRSIRLELSRILALATVYGEKPVHTACMDLLSRGIIGVEALELTLKSLHDPTERELSPAPINFSNEKLNRVMPGVDLRRYDALLFDGDLTPSASEGTEKKDGNESE